MVQRRDNSKGDASQEWMGSRGQVEGLDQDSRALPSVSRIEGKKNGWRGGKGVRRGRGGGGERVVAG